MSTEKAKRTRDLLSTCEGFFVVKQRADHLTKDHTLIHCRAELLGLQEHLTDSQVERLAEIEKRRLEKII